MKGQTMPSTFMYRQVPDLVHIFQYTKSYYTWLLYLEVVQKRCWAQHRRGFCWPSSAETSWFGPAMRTASGSHCAETLSTTEIFPPDPEDHLLNRNSLPDHARFRLRSSFRWRRCCSCLQCSCCCCCFEALNQWYCCGDAPVVLAEKHW